MPRCRSVALCVVRTVVRNHEHIKSKDPSFFGKSDFHPTLKTGPRPSYESLLLAADPHHDRGVGLLRQKCRDNHGDAAGYFAAEPATRIFADEHHFLLIHVHPSCYGRPTLGRALSSGVKVDLAVLPVSHRAAGLQSLMADVWRDECFVQHERGILEACVEVAIRPLVRCLAHWQSPVPGVIEIRVSPLELRNRWRIPALGGRPN